MRSIVLAFCLSFILLPDYSHAASALVDQGVNLQFGGAECSVTITASAGSTFYAAFAWTATAESLTSIQSDVDGAFTLADNPTGDASGEVAHGYLLGVTSGSHTITSTRSANTSACELYVFELTDAGEFHASGGNAQTAPGTGTDAVVSDALSTGADGIMVGVSFDIGVGTRPNLGSSPNTSCGETGTFGRCSYKTTSGSSTTLTWTETEAFANTLSMAMTFSPSGGAPPATPNLMLLGVGP